MGLSILGWSFASFHARVIDPDPRGGLVNSESMASEELPNPEVPHRWREQTIILVNVAGT